MRLRSAVATVATLLPLIATSAATAAPPEGCVGLPSVPEAYVCIVSWTPENAVPTVTPGSETVWLPEVCVFTCIGPTPVTVPGISPNSGTIAVVRYRDQDYSISTSSVPQPPMGSTLPPPGFAGKGCSVFAVEDRDQPNTWLTFLQGGPVRATDPSYTLTSARCAITLDGNVVFIDDADGQVGVTTLGFDRDTVLGVCLEVQWTYEGQTWGDFSCTNSVAVGTTVPTG